MPLNKGGWHALLHRGVYCPGKFLGAKGGVYVYHLDVIRTEYSGIAAMKGVRLRPREVFMVVCKMRNEDWMDDRVGHVLGDCCAVGGFVGVGSK